MKVLSSTDNEMIIQMTRWEFQVITGARLESDADYKSSTPRPKDLVGKEFDCSKIESTIKTAEAVTYRAKDAIAGLDRAKKELQSAFFPFFDTYEATKVKEDR